MVTQLTHLAIFHEQDVQGVQGAEVEDINVVLHSHLGWKGTTGISTPPTHSSFPKCPVPSHPMPLEPGVTAASTWLLLSQLPLDFSKGSCPTPSSPGGESPVFSPGGC